MLKKLIIDALRNVRFNNGRGYYFIYDKTGKNLWNHQNSKGRYILKDMIKGLEKSDNIFYEGYWFNSSNKYQKKIGLVKNFEPFDWFIRTVEYIEDFEKVLQNRILKHINDIRFGKNGYIFVVDYNTIYLSHIKKNYIENNDAEDTEKVFKNLLNKKFAKYKKKIDNNLIESNKQQNIIAQQSKMAAMREMIEILLINGDNHSLLLVQHLQD